MRWFLRSSECHEETVIVGKMNENKEDEEDKGSPLTIYWIYMNTRNTTVPESNSRT